MGLGGLNIRVEDGTQNSEVKKRAKIILEKSLLMNLTARNYAFLEVEDLVNGVSSI